MGVDVKKALESVLDKALVAQAPAARANIDRLRRLSPDASPADIVKQLNKSYLSAVTVSGGTAGASAVLPGAGLPTSVLDAMAFTEASVFYVLSRAELQGVSSEDIERRRFMVYTVLVGDSANAALGKSIPKVGNHWGKKVVEGIPMAAIKKANTVLGPRFITKYGTKQGVLVLGKQVPLGIGAAVGGGGNFLFGRATIKVADKLFGPAPTEWDHGPTGGSTA